MQNNNELNNNNLTTNMDVLHQHNDEVQTITASSIKLPKFSVSFFPASDAGVKVFSKTFMDLPQFKVEISSTSPKGPSK